MYALAASVFFTTVFPINTVYATEQQETEDIEEETTQETEYPESYFLPIESNAIEGWPAGPQVEGEAAVVMDAETGTFLYSKNMEAKEYPASITKIMTTLVALEHGKLKSKVKFSEWSVNSLETDSSRLWMDVGEWITLEQALYGIILESANDCANAVAEKIGGSEEGFAELMNQKAAALGCTGTYFVNPNGLHNNDHYTTPYDMALIGRAAFQNQTLCKVATTVSYQLPATKKSGARTITMGHKMVYPNDSRYYQGIIGGKTGYTSLAGNTLVTGAERNGTRLIAVVMKSKSTHYEDTKALLDYGFAVMSQSGAVTAGSNAAVAAGLGAASGSGTTSQVGPGAAGGSGTTSQVGPGAASGSGTTSQAGPGASGSVTSGWGQDDKGWYYIKENKTRASGEWLNLGRTEYWIDSDGYMATGWRHFTNGAWYYFRSNGAMAANYWVEDKGKWFYLGSDGAMLTNARTPDGYQLGADGAWTGK